MLKVLQVAISCIYCLNGTFQLFICVLWDMAFKYCVLI